MTAIAYKSIGNGTFTDAILDANFQVIGDYTQHLERYLISLSDRVVTLTEAHDMLAKKVVKLSKRGRVLPFVIGAGVGVYVYKRLKKSGLSVEFDAQTGSLRAQKPAETTPKASAETTFADVKANPDSQNENFEG